MSSGEGGCFGCCSGCVGEVLHHAAFSNTRSLARLPQLLPTLRQALSAKMRALASPRLSDRWCWRMATAAARSQAVWQGRAKSHENGAVWQSHTEHRLWSPQQYFSLDQNHLGSESAHSISPCCNSHHGAAHEFNSCQIQAGTALTTAPGIWFAWSRTAWSPAPAVPCSTGWLLWAPVLSHLDVISLPADITSGLSRLQFQALRLMKWDSPRAVDLKTWNFQVLLYFL